MNDKEIKDIACKYVEEVYNGDTDFIDEAVSIIGWLLLDHCIVNREQVQKLCRLAVDNSMSVDYGLIDGLYDMMEDMFEDEFHSALEDDTERSKS